jgi:sarcosine oxidase subunit beta
MTMQFPDRSFQVAVVGAGITGLSIAYNLVRRGVEEVAVFDKAGIGAGASGIQPGGVRRQWGTRLNCLLTSESFAFYARLGEELDATDAPVLQRCGYLFVAQLEATLERMRRDVELQQSLGIPSEILQGDELAEVVPGFNADRAVGAAYCRDDAYFDRPQSVVELFAQAARARGVLIEQLGLERLTRDGAGWLLEFRDGARAVAGTVVIAAGAESRGLLEPLGVDLPIEAQPKYFFLSEPIRERLLEPLVVLVDRHFAAKHLSSGRVLASDLAASGSVETNEQAWRAHIRTCIEQTLPVLSYVPFGVVAEGIYDMTPDHQPIVGEVGDEEGLWVAAGFSGHGFMLAPVIGRMVAEAVCDNRIDPLVEQLRLARFAEGAVETETAVV